MNHELKTWPDDFRAVVAGSKTHEARANDRHFSVGDFLSLVEWAPDQPASCDWKGRALSGTFTGASCLVEVTHVTVGQYGLPTDLAIMSIRLVPS